MKLLSDFIVESTNDEYAVTAAELAQYIAKVGKTLSKDVQAILIYCQKYNILTKEEIIQYMMANKRQLNDIAYENGDITIQEAQDLQKLLKNLGEKNLRILPMFQTEDERNDMIKGKKQSEDMALDLESEKGRAEVAKKYMPLVTAIASKFIGKSALGKNELVSAGMLGLVYAMNDYRKPDSYIDADDKVIDKKEAKEQKHLTFKQYAGWRIRNAILYDINHLSRVVKTGQYGYEKNKAAGLDSHNFEVSIDRDFNGDDLSIDKFATIAIDPKFMTPDAKEQWNQLFKILEKKFNARSLSIFYKYFGLNGYEKMKGQEIAKEFGVTSPRISGIIKNIMSYLKDDPKTRALLADLMELYTESLLLDNFGKDKEAILEAFAQDDIYILLEDLTRWNNKDYLQHTLTTTIASFDKKSVEFLIKCLNGGFDFLDTNYKREKKLIIAFLEKMYPTEQFSRKSDVYILEKFMDIIDAYKEFKIKL